MHNLDVEQMLVELQKDSAGLSNALWYAETGIQNINRVLDVAEDFHQGDLEYDVFADSLANIGILFLNQTYEIEDFTYNSLLTGVRMYQFPSDLAKDVRAYYEHGEKMFGEQNPEVHLRGSPLAELSIHPDVRARQARHSHRRHALLFQTT